MDSIILHLSIGFACLVSFLLLGVSLVFLLLLFLLCFFLLFELLGIFEHLAKHLFLCELLEELEDQGDVVVSPSFILRLPLGSFLSFLNNDLLLYLYLRPFTFLGLEGSELLLSLDLFIIDDSQKVEPDLSGRVLFDSLLDLFFCFGQPGLLGHLAEADGPWLETVELIELTVVRHIAYKVVNFIIILGRSRLVFFNGKWILSGEAIMMRS